MKCKRCGKCCIEVGRTFWKAGNILTNGKPFGDCKELNHLAKNGDHEDGGLPCEMLVFDDGGAAVCKIERDYGRQYKPMACCDYPEENEKCFLEQENITLTKDV